MSAQKMMMTEEDLDKIAAAGNYKAAVEWFKKKYDEIMKKYNVKESSPI